MGRWSDSVLITRTALGMISQDRAFLLVPLLSGLTIVALFAVFTVPWIALALLTPGSVFNSGSPTLILLVLTYLVLYFASVFVGTFFTAALVGMAWMKFDGQHPSVGDGIRFARQHLRKIILWSLFSATVGLLLRAISQRLGGIAGVLVGVIGGATWAVATYFVIPVLVFEKQSTLGSVRRSASLFGQTLGRTILSNLLVALIVIGVAVPAILLIVVAVWAIVTGNILLAVASGVLAIGLLVFAAVLASALEGIIRTALYRYATTGAVVPGLVPRYYRTTGQPPMSPPAAPPPP
ncbi:MAG: DUF6159 family protein, partial [Candidatus Lutacidiplasmatales archaeon]